VLVSGKRLAIVAALVACRRSPQTGVAPDPSTKPMPSAAASIDVSSKKINAWDGTAYECGDVVQNEGLVRERVPVRVDGACEWWSLEWREKPAPACRSVIGGLDWSCVGFRHADSGALELVVKRDGRERDRFAVSSLFVGGTAVVSLCAPIDADETKTAAELSSVCSGRRKLRALVPEDIDHDGHATEFLLHVETEVGRERWVALGVSRWDARVHAFGTAEHPTNPLRMVRSHWDGIIVSTDVDHHVSGDEPCSESRTGIQTETAFRWDDAGLHATATHEACLPDGGVGAVVSRETL
jgi:hypothetical protein